MTFGVETERRVVGVSARPSEEEKAIAFQKTMASVSNAGKNHSYDGDGLPADHDVACYASARVQFDIEF